MAFSKESVVGTEDLIKESINAVSLIKERKFVYKGDWTHITNNGGYANVAYEVFPSTVKVGDKIKILSERYDGSGYTEHEGDWKITSISTGTNTFVISAPYVEDEIFSAMPFEVEIQGSTMSKESKGVSNLSPEKKADISEAWHNTTGLFAMSNYTIWNKDYNNYLKKEN